MASHSFLVGNGGSIFQLFDPPDLRGGNFRYFFGMYTFDKGNKSITVGVNRLDSWKRNFNCRPNTLTALTIWILLARQILISEEKSLAH